MKSTAYIPLLSLVTFLTIAGCALTLTPSPSDGSMGLSPSPTALSVGVATDTVFVNSKKNATAASLPATLDGAAVALTCSTPSNCNVPWTFAPGAHSLAVTALVTWPAFYSAPQNTPVACQVSYNRTTVTQCYSFHTKAIFGVDCTRGKLSVTNATMIPVPAGKSGNFQLSAQGGCPAYTWTVINTASLPPGISISASGLVSGTETAACTPDPWTYDNTIRVTDGFGDSNTSPMTFDICAK